MPKSRDSSKEVSIKDTKQDIFDAYQSIISEISEKPLTPAVIKKSENLASTVRENINQSLANLTKALSESVEEIFIQLEKSNNLINELYLVYNQKQKEFNDEEKQIKLTRQREDEEYLYDFEKRKKRQEEELKEAKLKEEVEIAQRKSDLKAQEDEVGQLRQQVKSFESQLTTAIKEAVTKTTKELTDHFTQEKTLAAQVATSTEKLLDQKAESLNTTILAQAEQIKSLQESLKQASSQLTRIAERAVEKGPLQTSTISPKS